MLRRAPGLRFHSGSKDVRRRTLLRRIHYDLTGVSTDNHIPALADQLARFPIAGCLEDALDARDIEASIELRRRSKLPIVRHQAPLEATFEVIQGAADAYIRGHQKIGVLVRQAGLFAAGNIPFMGSIN